jgi:hypothetical protein
VSRARIVPLLPLALAACPRGAGAPDVETRPEIASASAQGPRWVVYPPTAAGAPSARLTGAVAVRAGRAALVAGRWLEIVPSSEGRWSLHDAPLGGPIAPRPLPALDGCASAWLAADDTDAWLACAPRGEPGVVRVLRGDASSARLRQLRPVATLRAPSVELVGLFALGRGGALVQGACAADAAVECDAAAKVHLAQGRAGGVAAPARMVFYRARRALDGTVYGLGTENTGVTYLLASQDDGASFTATALPPVAPCGCDPTVEAALATGRDGEVAVVAYANAGRWLRYTSTDHGARVAGAMLPIDPDDVDLRGPRGLAFGPDDAWETLDLGATWQRVAAPEGLAAGAHAKARVACADEGCLVDAAAARLGWTR